MSDLDLYPAGIKYHAGIDLTTKLTIESASLEVRVSQLYYRGGANEVQLFFRNGADDTNYFFMDLGADETMVLDELVFDDGLVLYTDDVVATVRVACFYQTTKYAAA